MNLKEEKIIVLNAVDTYLLKLKICVKIVGINIRENTTQGSSYQLAIRKMKQRCINPNRKEKQPEDIYLNMHNFIINNTDTDSIMFSKPDESEFTEEEQEKLLEEINSILPPLIQMDHDGYFSRVLIFRAKNYVLYDGKTIKYKGSAIRSPSMETACRELINKFVDSLLNDRDDFVSIYHSYIKEAINVKDIKRWAARKTITSKTMESERANESKIMDAIEGTEYGEGDRVWVYFKEDKTLGLVGQFDGNYSVDKLLEKVYNTIKRFDTIMDCSVFLNYKLKRNKDQLGVINESCKVI